jgi:hypothetical protein
MTFTDDDLKRLKEDIETIAYLEGKSFILATDLKALFIRLEAAEDFREFVLEDFPGVTANAFVQEADIAWRKAVGK